MAFYSVRLNDQGEEIETTRKTYRKCNDHACGDTVSIKSTVRDSWHIGQTCRSSINSFRTVRYVNAATFIEKEHDPSIKHSLSRQDEHIDSDETNSDTFTISSSRSDQNTENHIQSNQSKEHIPNLELHSNESIPSSDNQSYSYGRVCEATKIIQKPEAYKEWLAAKRATLLYNREMENKRQEKEKQECKERKKLAEEKYREWLQRKSKSTAPVKCDQNNIGMPPTCDKSDDASNFNSWLERKRSKEKIDKEKVRHEHKRAEEEKMKRLQKAAYVYEEWLKTAPQKPKPVPLNQGVITLKGSISPIYINPIPWVSIDHE